MLVWKDGNLVHEHYNPSQSPFAEACAALDEPPPCLTPRQKHEAVGRSMAARAGLTYNQLIGHSRNPHVCDVRIEYVRYLNEQGLSQGQIGDIIRRERSVISYMLNRAGQLSRRRARISARRDNANS